jgi:energy-coupling factor transport system substrate-specific component
MDLQFWPWLGGASSIAYVQGDSFFENLTRFWVFHISTGFAWDIPRAIMTSTLLIFLGRPILSTLRRFTRNDYLT